MFARIILLTVFGSMLPACGGRQESAAAKRSVILRDRWEQVHALEVEGKTEAAHAGYRKLCDAEGAYERACYDGLRLRFDEGGDEHVAGDSVQFLQTFPDSGLSPQLVKHLARWFLDSDSPEGIARGAALLEQTAQTLAGEDVEDTLWYQAARLHRAVGQGESAELCLRRVVQLGRWGSQLWDDSLWRLAQLYRERGDSKGEIQALGELIASDESSFLVGSYRSGRVDDALLRLGELYSTLGRLDEGFETFLTLGGRTQSRLSDDGLYRAAQLSFKLGEQRRACRLLKRLLEKMSDSGRADQARALADHKCKAGR